MYSNTFLPLARQLNLFDITMIVMGGIIGSGIFMNPYVVARQAPNAWAILGVWAFGGAVAMAGAFVYADLAARNTAVGGQYAYLRDGWHPSVAFLYGWSLLLVIQTGGMAAVAVTFAHYLVEMTGLPWPPAVIAALTLMALAAVNLIGVRSGSAVQNLLMALKIAAIATLVFAGFFAPAHAQPTASRVGSLAGALTPVLFAYGGWQTASFLSGEMKNPESRPGPRFDSGRERRGGALSGGELDLRARPGSGSAGCNANAGQRGDDARVWRGGGPPGRGRHRGFHTGLLKPGHADRAQNLLRHGARWRLLRSDRNTV